MTPPSKYYTGIGSRPPSPRREHGVPADIEALMRLTGYYLASQGYILRSGHAKGSDQAFEKGCAWHSGTDMAEIYIPCEPFEDISGGRASDGWCTVYPLENIRTAQPVLYAASLTAMRGLHPTFDSWNDFARKAHLRNYFQVFGQSEVPVPSEFVVFWAPEKNDQISGGTRTAVYLARKSGIKTYNLYDPAVRDSWTARLQAKVPRDAPIWDDEVITMLYAPMEKIP